jgi:hypothetical protein
MCVDSAQTTRARAMSHKVTARCVRVPIIRSNNLHISRAAHWPPILCVFCFAAAQRRYIGKNELFFMHVANFAFLSCLPLFVVFIKKHVGLINVATLIATNRNTDYISETSNFTTSHQEYVIYSRD